MDFFGPWVDNDKATRTKSAIGNVTRNVDFSVVKVLELKGGFPKYQGLPPVFDTTRKY